MITDNSGAVLEQALKQASADIGEFCRSMVEAARDLAPPPPKFGDIPSTGHNAASIQYSVVGLNGEVFTQSGYGGWLEVGTSKMAAQPYFRPAFEQTRQDMEV